MYCAATPNVLSSQSRHKVYSLAPTDRLICLRIGSIYRPHSLTKQSTRVVCVPVSVLLEEPPNHQLLGSNASDSLVTPWARWAQSLRHTMHNLYTNDGIFGQRTAYAEPTGNYQHDLVVLEFDQRRLRAQRIHDINARGEICLPSMNCTAAINEGESVLCRNAPSGKGHVKTSFAIVSEGEGTAFLDIRILIDDEHGELHL
jgi:hypothetical protein